MSEVLDTRELLRLDDLSVKDIFTSSRIIQSKCEDFNVSKADGDKVLFTSDARLRYLTDDNDIRVTPMSRYALGQLGSKLGVPVRYLEKCIDTGKLDLAQDNVNSWIDDFNKDLFIREYNGRIRGILSSKYTVCDTPDILQVVSDVVDLNNYNVKGSFLNEERLHLRLVQKDMLHIDGEDLFAGLTIDSSDVGRSILNCNFIIYKQVCTNGLILAKGGGTLFQQKHIGICAEEFRKGLSEKLETIPQLITMITSEIEEKRNSGKLIKDITNDEEVQHFISNLRVNTKLSEDGANKVVEFIRNRTYSNSKWGLINSLTEVAQDYTLERRLELERYAGNILVA